MFYHFKVIVSPFKLIYAIQRPLVLCNFTIFFRYFKIFSKIFVIKIYFFGIFFLQADGEYVLIISLFRLN